MIYEWPSPAKLNLFLYITGRKKDGYHQLQTLFQFLDQGDTLTFSPREDKKINLLSPVKDVPNKKNLVVRAGQLLQQYCSAQGIKTQFIGADIDIKKQLPMGGGLGGGSSNAATTLIALNALWQCGLSDDTLATIGLNLGADVPIFVYGHAAFAEGIGEQLQSVTLPEKWYLVVHPGVSISTAQIFNDPELIRNTPARSLHTLLATPYSNDCEPLVKKRFYKVEQLLLWLLQYAPSRLTGTGACLFAEFDSELAALQVLKKVPNWARGFVARGTNISPLHRFRSEHFGT